MSHGSLIAVPASAIAVESEAAPALFAVRTIKDGLSHPAITEVHPLVEPQSVTTPLSGLSRFAAYSGLGHVLAVALCLVSWTNPPDHSLASNEINIEIVADAAPPEPEVQEVPPETTQAEQQANEEPKVENSLEPPAQVALADLIPPPPEAAPVVLPQPQVQPPPPPKKVVKQEPPKPRKKPEQQPRVARESTGQNEERVARTTSAPPSYLGQVSAMLHRAKVYPASARERGEQGRAVIRFTILRSGSASGTVIVRSSGHRELDLAASSVIARAGPFPPLPEEFALPSLSVTVPIEYSLR